MGVDKKTGLPEGRVFEKALPDNSKAILLYTDKAAEEWGKENIEVAFSNSLHSDMVVLFVDKDELSEYNLKEYAENNNLDGNELIRAHYLHDLFSKKLYGDSWVGDEDGIIDFWRGIGNSIVSSESFSNSIHEGFRLVSLDDVGTANWDLFYINDKSKRYLLGHEFEHCNPHFISDDPIDILREEGGADIAGLTASDTTDDVTGYFSSDRLLYLRTREAIKSSINHDISEPRNSFQEFFSIGMFKGFGHATSAIIDSKNKLLTDLDRDRLEDSLIDFKSKIDKHMKLVVQETLFENISGDFGIEANLREKRLVGGLKDFLKDEGTFGRYQIFVETAEDHVKALDKLDSKISSMNSEDLGDFVSLFETDYNGAMKKIEKEGLDKSKPEVVRLYEETYRNQFTIRSELSFVLSTMKNDDPELYKELMQESKFAKILDGRYNEDETARRSVTSELYKVLSEMKEKGEFEGDLIQQRMVDAFLKGVDASPDDFDKAIVEQRQQELAKAPLEVSNVVSPAPPTRPFAP